MATAADPQMLARIAENLKQAQDSSKTVLQDVFDIVEKNNLSVMNDNPEHPFSNCFDKVAKENENVCETDADEQLLVTLPFGENVKLHSFLVKGPEGGKAPKKVRVFVNQLAMDFSDAEDAPADFEIELSEGEVVKGQRVVLDGKAFKSPVSSMTLFFVDNQEGGEITAIKTLSVFGYSTGARAGKLEKVGSE
mmetsp:Transcript_7534/g.19512  ORF Transcript_7534/g.19512 Transcript_7534/m.19512 type:complete len:193 (-) Transcript_7534:211-789(-)